MTPYFAGVAIFGEAVEMQSALINPRATQSNTFPGVNGVEELDQGERGGFTHVSGTLVGATESGLAAAEIIFRSFYDGNAYVLTDTLGTSWGFVKLESFEPQGRVYKDTYGICCRKYRARFRHLLMS